MKSDDSSGYSRKSSPFGNLNPGKTPFSGTGTDANQQPVATAAEFQSETESQPPSRPHSKPSDPNNQADNVGPVPVSTTQAPPSTAMAPIRVSNPPREIHDLLKVDKAPLAILRNLEQDYGGVLDRKDISEVERAILMGAALTDLKAGLGPFFDKWILPLQNTDLGFQTDNKDGYQKSIVLDCVVQGILCGLGIAGNLWNIIAGRFYIRKEGYISMLVRQRISFVFLPNLPYIEIQKLFEGGGYVRVPWTVKWRYIDGPAGQTFELGGVSSVRVNKSNKVAVEAVSGKTERKALKALFARVNGVSFDDDDLEDIPPESSSSESPSVSAITG